MADQRGGIEDVRGAEGVNPAQLEPRRVERRPRRDAEIVVVHPELAGAEVADDPVRLERGCIGWVDRATQQDRDPPAGRSGDRGEPAQFAR